MKVNFHFDSGVMLRVLRTWIKLKWAEIIEEKFFNLENLEQDFMCYIKIYYMPQLEDSDQMPIKNVKIAKLFGICTKG